MSQFRIGLAQINSTVGDLDGNSQKIIEYIHAARDKGIDLIAFPELALIGYPPEDLLLKPSFLAEAKSYLEKIIENSTGIAAVVGCVERIDTDIFNGAAIFSNRNLINIYHKILLPNYGVFDEERYFEAGAEYPVFTVRGIRIGVNICEDIWFEDGPTSDQCAAGAEIIVNINGSPYHRNKRNDRYKMLKKRAQDNNVIVTYTNLVGGQDELVFDGSSMILDHNGLLLGEAKQFEEDLLIMDFDTETLQQKRIDPTNATSKVIHYSIPDDNPEMSTKPKLESQERWTPLDSVEEVHHALVIGTRDYVTKSGFQKVLIGMSGGIDSALTMVLAVEALSAENVTGITMPTRFSSEGSVNDSIQLAKNLGVNIQTIPIETTFNTLLSTLEPVFADTKPNTAEENLQARIRGNILMAVSNKFGWLVLTTGNKSEMATGYATLYGDMAGGFAVIKDVPKTLVYELSERINESAEFELIPREIIDKEPSAELRENQKDIDSLPPYSTLDPILEAYVEKDRSIEDMVEMGFDLELVKQAVALVDKSEYKRRQAPPGVKITPRAFGRDRRLPIVNKYNPLATL